MTSQTSHLKSRSPLFPDSSPSESNSIFAAPTIGTSQGGFTQSVKVEPLSSLTIDLRSANGFMSPSPDGLSDNEENDSEDEQTDVEQTTKAKFDRYRAVARQFIDEATTEIQNKRVISFGQVKIK